MITGKTNGYSWIEGTKAGIHSLVSKCPSLFLGKTVAITSFDSGPLKPNEDEKKMGWYSSGDVFYATNVRTANDLPYDNYDEWYVFDELKEFTPEDPFVNYKGFALRDPNYQLEEADPTWDKAAIRETIEYQKGMQDRFWDYVSRISPRAFVMDGGLLICGSKDKGDFELIKETLVEEGACHNASKPAS